MKSRIFISHFLALSLAGVGFVIASLGVTAAFRLDAPASSPFSAFESVFPGQPERAVEAHGFVCPTKAYDFFHDALEYDCILQPEAGIFSMVEVGVSGGSIQRLTFSVRGNALRLGDLALLLGMPDDREQRFRYSVTFSWRGKLVIVSTVGRGEEYSLFRRVWQVTFTNTPL